MGISTFLGSGSFLAIPWKLEQTYPSIVPITDVTTLPELIKIVFNFSLGVSALLLFFVLCSAGILFLVSAGDPVKQRHAKQRLGSAALGSILLLTSYLAANIFAPELLILKPTGVPNISLTKTPLFAPQCSDGIDNDGDGKTDFPTDPNCQNATDESEFLIECSDGIDNDGDGKTDFPSDVQCKDLSSISESFEYKCVASSDPDSGVALPEITETYPLMSRSKQALATLDTIRTLLKNIQDRSTQIASVTAQSQCASTAHDHGIWGGKIPGSCSGEGEDHGHCQEADENHCHPFCKVSEPPCPPPAPAPSPAPSQNLNHATLGSSLAQCGGGCIEWDCTPEFHDLKIVFTHNWECHRAGGKWNGGGNEKDVGAIDPTSIPTLTFINETVDLIERDEAGSKGIKKTLEALRDSGDPVKNPPYSLIIPRDEDKTDDGKPFLLSLKRVEDELKGIRDAMNICSRTPNEQVFTFKNIVARGVDAPKPCKDAGGCPEDNDFACLFLPGTK